METLDAETGETTTIGPDRIHSAGSELTIDARHPMPDWDVREINHVPIYFADRKYCLIQKRTAQPPFAVRYVLALWPADLSSCAKGFHSYDAETVAAREALHRCSQFDELVHALLLPFYPLLGFLWSGTQKRLMRFGFMPHTVSGISIFTGFCLLFGQGVFAVVLINASAQSGKMALGGLVRALVPGDFFHLGPLSIPVSLVDMLLIVALSADVVIRYSAYLREDEWSGGFLEWLVR
jgi:hypothetical protein